MGNAYINISNLIRALTTESPGGETFTPEEAREVYRGEHGTLAEMKMQALAEALNSIEEDGTRLSLEELTHLRENYYYEPGDDDFIKALSMEACRQKIPNLFSSDALEKIGFEGCKDDMAWFDVYQRFLASGLAVGFDEIRTFTKLFEEEMEKPVSQLLQFGKFWHFVEHYLAPHYVENDRSVNLLLDGSYRPLLGVGIFIAYTKFSNILMDPGFMEFAGFVETHYLGIRIIDDIGYYVDLYRNEGAKAELIRNAPIAKAVTRYIPVRGSLDPNDIDSLLRFWKEVSGDEEKLQAIGEYVDAITIRFGFRRPATELRELDTVLQLFGDEELNREIQDDKVSQYITVLFSPLTDRVERTPERWEQIPYFVKTVRVLPDNPTHLIGVIAMLRQYNFDFTVRLRDQRRTFGRSRYDFLEFEYSLLSSPEESARVLAELLSLDRVREILRKFYEKNPEAKTALTLYQLGQLLRIAQDPESPEWIDHYQAFYYENLGSFGRNFFPLWGLECMATATEEERSAAMTIIRDHPQFVAKTGLGCRGIKTAPELLKKVIPSEMYRVLTEDLEIQDVEWTMLAADLRHKSSSFQALLNPIFIDAAKKVFEAVEENISEGQKPFLRSYHTISSMLFLYTYYQKPFLRLSQVPADTLSFFAPIIACENCHITAEMGVRWREHQYFSSHNIDILVFIEMKSPGLLEKLQEIFSSWGLPTEGEYFVSLVLTAYFKHERFEELANPELVAWYKKLSSDDPATRFPYSIRLPKIEVGRTGFFAGQSEWERAIDVLPIIYSNRHVFHMLDTLEIAPTWTQLQEIFTNPNLIEAIRSPEFVPYYTELRAREGNIDTELLIKYIKLAHKKIPLDLFKTVAALGYDNVETFSLSLVQINPEDPTLRDPGFKIFIERVEEELLDKPSNITELPWLINLYKTLWSSGASLDDIFTDQFKDLLGWLRVKFDVKSTCQLILNAYLDISRHGVSISRLEGLMQYMGRPASANDIPTLVMIAQNEHLEMLFKDRAQLEKEIETRLEEREMMVREDVGFYFARGKSERYTERPPLDILDHLFLVRTYIMLEQLDDRAFVEQFRSIAESDIRNKRTEAGGVIRYSPGLGRLIIDDEISLSFEDGAFLRRGGGGLDGGIIGYHLHALEEDTSEFAGASGGDYNTSMAIDMPGLVVTACGRDEAGQLIINFDIYYQTKESARAGELRHFFGSITNVDVDLGVD